MLKLVISKPSKATYYAIYKGRKRGVFKQPWEYVEPLIRNYHGAVYQAFDNYADALSFSMYGRKPFADVLSGTAQVPITRNHLTNPRAPQTIRTLEQIVVSPEKYVIVYTKSACTNNQEELTAISGCGLFWGDNHRLNTAFVLPIPPHTAKRADMYAIIHAFECYENHLLELGKQLWIYTDSPYCLRIINVMHTRKREFRESNWTLTRGKQASNVDLLVILDTWISKYPRTIFKKASDPGSTRGKNMANRLAVGVVDAKN
jgi:ribonuclease HI